MTARLKYVAESEWGSRRYLDATLLGATSEGRPKGCRKVRKNLAAPRAKRAVPEDRGRAHVRLDSELSRKGGRYIDLDGSNMRERFAKRGATARSGTKPAYN